MNMVVSHWSANAALLVAYVVLVVVHLRGMHANAVLASRLGGGQPEGAVREAVVFHSGLLVILLALVSPVGYWAQRFVWVRSFQDLLLAFVAPSLIVLGAPWLALARGAGLRPAGDGGRQEDAAVPRAPSWLSWPVAITVAFNAAWCGWHVPALYDAALRYPLVYAAEVVTYLGLGVAFWLQLIGSRPLEPRFPPLQRVMLVVGTVIPATVLGMVLSFNAGLLYPAYASTEHRVLRLVADQQLGGAVLWVLILPPLIITAVALLIRWLNEEESKDLAAGFERLLTPPKSAWPSRPGPR
jgi:cytochrome c oxidase assembly factor CtaG